VGIRQTNPQQVSEATHTKKNIQGQRLSTLDQQGHQVKHKKNKQIIQSI
jgi:hypothetical protein